MAEKVNPVDVTVRFHFSSMGSTACFDIDGSDRHPMYGIPLDLFGVQVQSGRRYRLTIEELPDSKPVLKENPWNKGQWA